MPPIIESLGFDLRIDFQMADENGLTRGSVRNLRSGLDVEVGDVLVVCSEDGFSRR
jgi:hypothetical protein